MDKEALERIRQQIKAGELEEGLEALELLAKNSSSRYREEIILHLASAKNLKADMRKGILTTDQFTIQRNRITFNVLELLEEL